LPAVGDVATRYEADLARLVRHHRIDEHDEHPEIGAPETGMLADVSTVDHANAIMGVTDVDTATLLEFRRIWFDAVGLQLTKQRAKLYSLHLARLKNRRMGVVTAPPRAERARTITDAAAKLRTSVSNR